MDFLQAHGKRLEAVVVAEEVKLGPGALFVNVQPEENKFDVYYVPTEKIPHASIKKKMETVTDTDKFIYVILQDNKRVMTTRLVRSQKPLPVPTVAAPAPNSGTIDNIPLTNERPAGTIG
jgi:hypothetical protein